jgi:hypothetical protein
VRSARIASIYPTADEINAMPEKFRQYIHDLETRCDKSGDVQTIALPREVEMHYRSAWRELEAEIDRLKGT